MDKKTRILELVNKKIITADEAIDLLEKLEGDKPQAEGENIKVVQNFDTPSASEDEKIYQALKEMEEAKRVEESIAEDEPVSEKKTKEGRDFSEQINQTFSQAKKEFEKAKPQIKDATKQTAEIVKNTFSLLSGTVKDYIKSEDTIFNKFSGVVTTIEKDFQFENLSAIDIENTTGKIEFVSSDVDYVAIHAQVKIYGSLEEKDAQDLFEEKSSIEVDEAHLKFRVLNKRMTVNLKVAVPKTQLNNLSIKTINGDIELSDVAVEDIYLKSTNGNIKASEAEITHLEIEGVNGQVKLSQNKILETTITTVNGNVTGSGDIQNIKVKLVNGDIKLTFNRETLRSIGVSNVNGAVKVAIPRKLGLRGEIKTNFGKILERLEDLSTTTEKAGVSDKYKIVTREGATIVSLDVKTTSGNIYLKDAEK